MMQVEVPSTHRSPPRTILALLAGGLLVLVGILALSSEHVTPAETTTSAATQLSTMTGGISTNGRQDLSIVGCAGFNCQKKYICIDKWKRCTDNWCTVKIFPSSAVPASTARRSTSVST